MKKFISSSIASLLLLTTSISPAYASAYTLKTVTKKLSVEDVFKDFKKSVFIEGKNMEVATGKLVNKLIDSKISSGELELYVAQNSSKKDYKKFTQMLDTALEDVDSLSELGKEDYVYVLKSVLSKTEKTGSHFMSCAAGRTIGVPLIVVAVVLGVISVVNATASKELVTQDYIDKRRKKQNDYLNTVADLEAELTTYESDIIYYQDEIAELKRRIDSGNYSTEEIENMYLILRDNEFLISDARALINEVNVDLNYFQDKYTADLATYEQEELSALSRVDEKKASAGKYAIAAGIVGGIGSVFAVAGLSDCN